MLEGGVMNRMKKRILITVPIAILLAIFSLYFLFPGTIYKILISMERKAAGLVQKNIDIGEWKIEYLEGGQGDVLVLLHGFGGNKDNWTRIAKFLTPHFRVIIPDLPGFGESTKNFEAEYNYTAQVDRIHKFLSALDINAFHLGGNSMGGTIASTYTANYGDEILSLWLIATGGIVSSQPSELNQRIESGEPNPLIVDTKKDYDRLLDFIFVNKPPIPGPIKRYFTQEAINNRPLNQIIFKQIRSADSFVPLEILLRDSKTKTLILWGDKDRVLHVSGAKILESVMPNAKSVVMENVGHVPMLERPEESANIFINFVRSTES